MIRMIETPDSINKRRAYEMNATAISLITLRDYFAAQALPAIYRQTVVDFDEGKISAEDASPNAMAHEAYQIANAMLAERERWGE